MNTALVRSRSPDDVLRRVPYFRPTAVAFCPDFAPAGPTEMRAIPVLAAIFYFGKPIAPHARPRTTPGPSGKEDIMKRALLVMVIAIVTAPVGTWHPVVAATPA